MTKLRALPGQSIIDGLKGVIDYYVHYQSCDRSSAGSGTPCARSWPRSPGQDRAPAVEAQWPAFTYAATNWNSLDPYVQDAYKATVQETNLTPRDLFTKAFITDYFRNGQWDAPALPPPPIIEEYKMLSAAVAYPSLDQENIPNNTPTKVILDQELYDINGDFDTVNSRFIAPKDGRYLVTAAILWNCTVADKRHDVHIYKNGAFIRGQVYQTPLIDFLSTSISCILDLDTDDFVELYAYHLAGVGTPDILTWGSAGWTRLEVSLIE